MNNNNLFQATPIYATGDRKNDPKTIGGLNKSNRITRIQAQKNAVEYEFMNFAFKINRSERQAESRREKRKL